MVDYYLCGYSYRETAEFFEVNVKTIVKWVKRYKEEGLEGLKDRKRAPYVVHNKTKKEVEDLVIAFRYQITARDVRSGALYFFYTKEKSVAATTMVMKILLTHLFNYGIKAEDITIQTDNGAEFSGIKIHHNRGFRAYLKKE